MRTQSSREAGQERRQRKKEKVFSQREFRWARVAGRRRENEPQVRANEPGGEEKTKEMEREAAARQRQGPMHEECTLEQQNNWKKERGTCRRVVGTPLHCVWWLWCV